MQERQLVVCLRNLLSPTYHGNRLRVHGTGTGSFYADGSGELSWTVCGDIPAPLCKSGAARGSGEVAQAGPGRRAGSVAQGWLPSHRAAGVSTPPSRSRSCAARPSRVRSHLTPSRASSSESRAPEIFYGSSAHSSSTNVHVSAPGPPIRLGGCSHYHMASDRLDCAWSSSAQLGSTSTGGGTCRRC